MEVDETENWDLVLSPKKSIFTLNLDQIWKYKDLLVLFVRRDFVAFYKQTVLGPLWFFIQPILTTITFTIIFGSIAKISTDGVPLILFYMSGITMWNYFADCINKTSKTFLENQALFGKVYFPRILVPLSVVITNLLKFLLQFLLLVCIWVYYLVKSDGIQPQWTLVFLPLMILCMAVLGLGIGMVISSLTTKYRDLSFLVVFGVQLMMYASPIVYPLSVVPEKYKWLIMLNPMSSIIETFKHGFLGKGEFEPFWLLYTGIVTLVVFFGGILIFNKVEKSFIDTV
jgi:lipopolysaccharide transport system permease protein